MYHVLDTFGIVYYYTIICTFSGLCLQVFLTHCQVRRALTNHLVFLQQLRPRTSSLDCYQWLFKEAMFQKIKYCAFIMPFNYVLVFIKGVWHHVIKIIQLKSSMSLLSHFDLSTSISFIHHHVQMAYILLPKYLMHLYKALWEKKCNYRC